MSILLEAHRKTAQNRKLQQEPTIHSEEPGRPAPEPLKAGPLLAMITLALAVSGWFTWRQYQLPEVASQLPVSQAAGQERASDSTNRSQEPRVETALIQVEDKPAAAPSNPLDQATPKPPRTPVEAFQAASSSPSSAGGGDTGLSPAAMTNQDESTPAPPEQDSAHVPEPIGYWELPDAIRAQVPEIRFNVLVYNQDSAQRFVLIDGRRLAEGDSVQPGLQVQEIRRDGVIFSYRLYKFLVKR